MGQLGNRLSDIDVTVNIVDIFSRISGIRDILVSVRCPEEEYAFMIRYCGPLKRYSLWYIENVILVDHRIRSSSIRITSPNAFRRYHTENTYNKVIAEWSMPISSSFLLRISANCWKDSENIAIGSLIKEIYGE